MVNILHMSDLHLSKFDDSDYISFLTYIEDRIKKCGYKPNIIIITGDIVDRGNSKIYRNVHERFIQPLQKYTECDNIFFTPGNHDAMRSNNVYNVLKKNNWVTSRDDNGKMNILTESDEKEFNLKALHNKQINIFEHYSDEEYQGLLTRYADFVDFYRLIDPTVYRSYGVKQISIGGSSTSKCTIVRIIYINSAILSHDYNDYQRLVVSEKQLNDIFQEINEKNFDSPDLSIAIMHHPLDWLTIYERNLLLKFFSDQSKLPIDILFNGHTHECKLCNIIDLDTGIVNFITGSAYNEMHMPGETKGYRNCRMAYYSVNTDEKIISGELSILNSADKTKFVPDTSRYSSVNNDGKFVQIYGEKLQELIHSAYSITIPVNKKRIVGKDTLESKSGLYNKIWKSVDSVGKKNKQLSKRYSESVLKVKPNEQEEFNIKVNILKEWLTIIATTIKTNIFENDTDNSDVRVHFRRYDSKEDRHIELVSTYGEGKLTPIPWSENNNLIFHAFEKKCSLVKSCNPNAIFDTGNNTWLDFLSASFYDREVDEEIRPLLSFGISVKGNNAKVYSEYLQLLSNLCIEKFIEVMCTNFDSKVFSIPKVLIEMNK